MIEVKLGISEQSLCSSRAGEIGLNMSGGDIQDSQRSKELQVLG